MLERKATMHHLSAEREVKGNNHEARFNNIVPSILPTNPISTMILDPQLHPWVHASKTNL
jgi:hypothetical protein